MAYDNSILDAVDTESAILTATPRGLRAPGTVLLLAGTLVGARLRTRRRG